MSGYFRACRFPVENACAPIHLEGEPPVQSHSEYAASIWSGADLLRDPCKRCEYQDVIGLLATPPGVHGALEPEILGMLREVAG
jgi:hypothetical protein